MAHDLGVRRDVTQRRNEQLGLSHAPPYTAPAANCTTGRGEYSRARAQRMHFGFSDEQEMLRESARKFLAAACPSSVVRAMMADPTAHAPGLWRQIAEL